MEPLSSMFNQNSNPNEVRQKDGHTANTGSVLGKRGAATVTQSGQFTPDPTPEPEDATQGSTESGASGATDSQPKQPETTSKDSFDPNEDEDEVLQDEDDEEDDELTKNQKIEAKRIMALEFKKKNFREILKLNQDYGSVTEQQDAARESFKSLGHLLHPDFTDVEGAKMAFNRLKSAARGLGVKGDIIKEVEDWNGGEMDVDNENKYPFPHHGILEIYKEATLHLGKVLAQPGDQAPIAALDALNNKIIQSNVEAGINPPDQWTIDLPFFVDKFTMVKPYVDRIMSNPDDSEALKQIETVNADFDKKNTMRNYPNNWKVMLPERESLKKAQAAAKAKAEAEAKAKAEAEAKAKAEAEAKAKAEAEAKAKEAAAAAAASAAGTSDVVEYPWVTGTAADGRVIVAHLKRYQKGELKGHNCILEDPITRVREVVSGSEVGELELEQYLALEGIKQWSEKDETGIKPKRVWSWKDKNDFKSFHWAAIGSYKVHDDTKGYKSPGTICCVTMNWGLDLCQFSELKDTIGLKSTKAKVQIYCKKKGITAPWDIEPEKILIPNNKGQRNRDKMGRTSSGEGIQASNISGSSSIDAGVEERVASRLEKKFESVLASNTGGSSLTTQVNELMESMKSMNIKMVAMEKKLEKVDEIEKASSGLAVMVQGLMEEFKKLKPTEVPT